MSLPGRYYAPRVLLVGVLGWAIAGDHTLGAEPVQKALAKVTSLVFERQPFDMTLQLLSEEIGVPIKFDGTNLQSEGITRNLPIAELAEENKPAKEILRVVLTKANAEGKLCYAVVVEKGIETIYVTTRDGVKKNGWKLPPEFAEPPKKPKPTHPK